jgi:hypothetical protein
MKRYPSLDSLIFVLNFLAYLIIIAAGIAFAAGIMDLQFELMIGAPIFGIVGFVTSKGLAELILVLIRIEHHTKKLAEKLTENEAEKE